MTVALRSLIDREPIEYAGSGSLKARTRILITAGAAVVIASAGGVAFAVSGDGFRPEANRTQVKDVSENGPGAAAAGQAPAVEETPKEEALNQPAASVTSKVTPGTRFVVGQALTSPNGQHTLVMQADGNLVLLDSGKPVWSTQTAGNPGGRAEFQADGNLVVRAANDKPTFYTATGKNRGALLAVQNDGNVVVYDSAGKGIWASKVQPMKIYPDQALHGGQTRTSADGGYRLSQQLDGNLVVEQMSPKKPLWSSQTHGNPGAYTIMGGDGNLVVYSKDEKPIWVSGTKSPGSIFMMQTDGNAVIRSADNKGIWGTTTNGISQLTKGQTMRPGQSRTSRNGQYKLQQQTDGNLVLVHAQRGPIWSSNTARSAGARAVMQHDGNLVVQDLDNKAVFASGTDGTGASFVVVQDDGNVVVYDTANKALWSTRTTNK